MYIRERIAPPWAGQGAESTIRTLSESYMSGSTTGGVSAARSTNSSDSRTMTVINRGTSENQVTSPDGNICMAQVRAATS